MIGSISKVRPAGHHHYYKYAHCYDSNDMNRVEASKSKNYYNDLDENDDFSYPLTGLRNLTNSAFGGWTRLKWFKDSLSKVNNVAHLFSYVSGGVEKMDITLLGTSYGAVPGIQMTGNGGAWTYKKREMSCKFPNATSINSCFQQSYFASGSKLKLYAPKATSASHVFNCEGGGGFTPSSLDSDVEFDTRNVKIATGFAANCGGLMNPSFPVDEDDVHTFVSGKTEVGRRWMTFPKLSSGGNMFNCSEHGKEYTLAFLNDLPDWSNDSGSHPLGFCCHSDLIGDPDVNLALKKVDKNFSEFAQLDEDVTADKGWTLTQKWAGTFTENEVMTKDFLEKMEFDTITLPPDYKRCIYLQDYTGSSKWINSGIIPNDTTGYNIIAKQLYKSETYSVEYPIGIKNTLCGPSVFRGGGTSNIFYRGNTQYTISGTGSKYGCIYEANINFLNSRNADVFLPYRNTLKPSLTDAGFPSMTYTGSQTLFLFGANDGSGALHNKWNGRIYRVKISEGTEIVRDFIPCLDPDGKPCMRDIINGVDYYNQGTDDDFTYELAPVVENDNGGSSGGDAQNVTLIDELVLSRTDSGVTTNFGKFSAGSPYVDSEVAIEDGYTVELSGMNSIGMLSENNGLTCGPAIGTAPMALIAPAGYSALIMDSVTISDYAKVSFNNGGYEILNTTSINDEVATAAITELPMDNWASPSLIGSAIVQWVVAAGTNIQGKIRNWKIYNGNTLVSDMYPATHNDGRNGLYCSIRDKFLPIQYYS